MELLGARSHRGRHVTFTPPPHTHTHYTRAHTGLHTRTHTRTQAPVVLFIRGASRSHALPPHTRTHARLHARTHAHTHIRGASHSHALPPTHAHTHVCTHAHTHAPVVVFHFPHHSQGAPVGVFTRGGGASCTTFTHTHKKPSPALKFKSIPCTSQWVQHPFPSQKGEMVPGEPALTCTWTRRVTHPGCSRP